MSAPNVKSPSTPQKGNKQQDSTLSELTKQVVKDIEGNKGYIRRAWQWILQLFSAGPRTEIYHDLLTIRSFAKRAIKRIDSEKKVDSEKIRTLATVQAYLILAGRERNFAQAWTYVNLAEALLPLVVEEKEVDACSARLRTLDGQMPDYLKNQIDIDEIDLKTKVSDNYKVHREQLVRSSLWNIANRKISLRLSLWRSIGIWLLMALGIAIFVAELMYAQSEPKNPLVLFPFLAVSALGFFGGGLSAFIKAREAVIKIPSYELIKVHTILRMLLGAAGAFVVYIAIQFLKVGDITKLLHTNIIYFLGIGIAAGFSERLFVKALEQISERLHIGPELKEKEENQQKSKESTQKTGIESPGPGEDQNIEQPKQ